jgi:ABC-2 type transport system permease protein
MQISIPHHTWRSQLSLVWAVAIAQLRLRTRYRGWFVLDTIIPTVMAAVPILLGRATGGLNAASNFQANTGTNNYVIYILIGSNVFSIVSTALWNTGFWLRREAQTGTLEALYLAPTTRSHIVAGIALQGALRSLFIFVLAFACGCVLFQVNPFQGDILIALAFLLIGMLPMFGLSLLFGALVLKIKEANALISLMQWVVSVMMGVYFPVTVFPPLLRFVALLFPPTWVNNGVRASLLGVSYFFDAWYKDLAILWIFVLVGPLLGMWAFARVERGMKRNEGVGQF